MLWAHSAQSYSGAVADDEEESADSGSDQEHDIVAEIESEGEAHLEGIIVWLGSSKS